MARTYCDFFYRLWNVLTSFLTYSTYYLLIRGFSHNCTIWSVDTFKNSRYKKGNVLKSQCVLLCAKDHGVILSTARLEAIAQCTFFVCRWKTYLSSSSRIFSLRGATACEEQNEIWQWEQDRKGKEKIHETKSKKQREQEKRWTERFIESEGTALTYLIYNNLYNLCLT